MISSCSAGYTVHCNQLVIHVIEQPRRFWCYFPFVSHESCWMSCSQSSGEMPGSWPFVTSLPLINLVKCNLTKLTTMSLSSGQAVHKLSGQEVHKLSGQAVHKLSSQAVHKLSS